MERRSLEELGVSLSEDVLAELGSLKAIRRDLHAHPELAHEERRTQQVILDYLAANGVEAEPIAGTGVVARLRGDAPGPVVLLRADMDALPISEVGDRPYRSTRDGVMHACGHDAHVAMLLVAAKILAKRGLSRGEARLAFQPAEEGGGGAAAMLEAGLLRDPRPSRALAFHVWSQYPVGEVAVLDGPAMASVDGFEMTVTGKGTHAAIPEAGVDPVVLASRIICAAQDIISRRKPAFEPAVLSFTSVHGGSAFNVIPEAVRVKGTLRAFDPTLRSAVLADLRRVAEMTASAFGGKARFDFFEELCATINDPAVAGAVRAAAREIVGDERTVSPRPLMVGEDFGLISREVPGALALLGCGNEAAGISNPHHHSGFDIDERVLPIGVELFARFVGEQLA